MEEDKLRQLIEEIDPEGKISKTKIEELISSINEIKQSSFPVSSTVKIIEDLRTDLQNEPDWRKKASLAAKIISMGLDT